MFLAVIQIVVKGTIDPASPIHFEGIVWAAPRTISHLSGEINVSGGEKACFHIIVKALFGKHD